MSQIKQVKVSVQELRSVVWLLENAIEALTSTERREAWVRSGLITPELAIDNSLQYLKNLVDPPVVKLPSPEL